MKSYYGTLFDYKEDICANRHRGSVQSVEAFESFKDTLPGKRLAALNYIERQGERGATAQEYADSLGVGINVVSGRFSELAKAELIKKVGTRNRGGVFVKA